jgi:NADH-quinone oxidoreductase subunit C
MDRSAIVRALKQVVPDAEIEEAPATDQPTLVVPAARNVEVCRALRDTPGLRFVLLSDVTAVDWWPAEPRFEVVYHLASFETRTRLRIKARVAGADARIATVTPLWPGANWPEREVWDLFGIVFDGHPDLRRLLMPDDWEGHPLRKDYPVQVRTPVQLFEPLGLTEEQFKANIEADRVVRPARREGQ